MAALCLAEPLRLGQSLPALREAFAHGTVVRAQLMAQHSVVGAGGRVALA